MGVFSNLFQKLFGKKQFRILTVGLDNSGKSTVINYMKPKKAQVLEIVPTPGYVQEEFKKNNVNLTVIDMSGQDKYRNLWEHNYEQSEAIIWVIDSTDKFRLAVVQNELQLMLEHKGMKNRSIPILFLANKSDIPGALTPAEISKFLELDQLAADKPWHISQTNALSGEGIEEGVQWLITNLQKSS